MVQGPKVDLKKYDADVADKGIPSTTVLELADRICVTRKATVSEQQRLVNFLREHPEEEVAGVFKWSLSDDFWSSKMGMNMLLKHYDTIKDQSMRPKSTRTKPAQLGYDSGTKVEDHIHQMAGEI
jgi:hypothetical protein